jgi:outer membrane protein TolC
VHLSRFVLIQSCVAMVGAFAAHGAAIAQDVHALAFDEALRLAEERSQQLRAEDAAALTAREMAAAAAEAPDPVLTAGISNLPVTGPDRYSLSDDFMTMRSVALSRELTRHDKRDARAERFTREAEVADAVRALALSDLQRETASAWLERYFRQRVREVIEQQRDQARLQVEAADLAYRSGLGSQSDVFAARAAVAALEDRLAAAGRDEQVATTMLARWIGSAAERPLAALPDIETVPLHTLSLEEQIANHPEIAVMLKQEAVARADIEIARSATRSDWTIEVMYSQRGPDYSNMMSLNVSKPIQWRESRRQGRELAARVATADRARAQREEETRAHVAEAMALLQSWQANRERLQRYTATLLPLTAERTAAATTAYRSRTGSLDAVLEARVGEIEAQVAHLELELETAKLWAGLNYLVPGGHAAGARQRGGTP